MGTRIGQLMEYDAALSRAEVERCVILMLHHLRQARQNGDITNLDGFRQRTAKLQKEIENAMRVAWFNGLQRTGHRIECDGCPSTFEDTGQPMSAPPVQMWISRHLHCRKR